MRRTRTLVVVAALGTFALGACGGSGAETATTTEPTTSVSTVDDTTTTVAALDAPAMEMVEGLVASTDNDLPVYAATEATTPALTLPAQTEFGSRRVVAVAAWQGADGEWLEVLLPERPNGSRGFVRMADVTLTEVNLSLDVDLTARQLRLLDNGNGVVFETAIAVGSAENPTPTGSFYLTDILITGDDGSAYGPYALGLSAHSETLSEFGGGDGQIGIHGTNQPSSIGQAVSHGCVRVPNDVVTELANMIPLGTSVVIH